MKATHKFLLLTMLVFVLIIQSVYADEVKNGDSIDTPIGNFTVTFYNSGGAAWRASIRNPGTTFLLDDGECKFQDVYEICFEGISGTTHDSARDIDIPTGEVNVQPIKPTIIREVDKSDLFVGETATVTVKITGPDGARIPYKYEDKWPKEILVESKEGQGFDVIGNKVILEGTLRGEEDIVYKIRLIQPTVAEVSAKLSYGNKEVIESGKLKITTKSILGISADLSEDHPQLGETVNMTVELNNKGEAESIDVTEFKITLPSGIQILDFDSELNKDGNILSWNGELTDDISFEVSFKANLYGDYKLEFRGKATDSGKVDEAYVVENLDLNPEELRLIMSMPRVITNPSEITIRAAVNNPNSDITFQNIKCSLSGVYSANFDLVKILPDREINLEDTVFSLEDKSARNVTEEFACSYETLNGQKFSVMVDKEAEIKDIDAIKAELEGNATVDIVANDTDNVAIEETKDTEDVEQVVQTEPKKRRSIGEFFKDVWRSIIESIFGSK